MPVLDKQKIMKRDFSMQVKAVDEENYIIRGIFSTNDEDRHGEMIDQKGWHLDEFMQNPVILFAHDQWTPAVGKAIELTIDQDGNLAGAIQFAVKEDKSGLSETLFNLYKNKFMRAFSVGFENMKYEYTPENDKMILKENTLYEISCVNVPANGRALAKCKGIDLSPLEKFEEDIKRKAMAETQKELGNVELDVDELAKAIAQSLQTEIISADKVGLNSKVVTPTAKGGFYSVRKINGAIRKLLKEKEVLNKQLK